MAKEPLHVEIVGTDLPGTSCGPSPEGGTYRGIQVALKRARHGWPRCARVRPPDVAWDVTGA